MEYKSTFDIITLCFMMFLSIFGSFFNLSNIMLVLCTKEMRQKQNNILIVNLALADFICLFTGVGISAINGWTNDAIQDYSAAAAFISGLSLTMPISVSIVTVAAIGVERLLCVCYNKFYIAHVGLKTLIS